MKRIEPFRIGEEIPSSAKFLSTEFIDNDYVLFYEIAIKEKKAPGEKQEDKEQEKIIERVINYLNKKTNGKYTIKNKATVKHIEARLAEDAKPEDFKLAIDNMCLVWLQDEKMSMYLRPSTLFGNKFYDYLKAKGEDKNEAFAYLEELNKKVLDDEKGTV